ncbi:hypothetical protein HJG60_010889 [Phyllostomus discolor]|uniref:Uncharacterized protein n=1 Tax=Phyllostomus discolor TaxID=89673 RepID=A0A834AH85_9CHIR|nr:hypothetical protein HJG60_010889 [Phyllostomus discolor]
MRPLSAKGYLLQPANVIPLGIGLCLGGRVVSYYLPGSAFSSSTDMPLGCVQSQQSLCTWGGKVYQTGVTSRTMKYQTRRCQAYGTLHPPDLGPTPRATVTCRRATTVLALQWYQHQYQQL